MKKYDSYKDSGIEWIGHIPEHWEVKKLKFIKSNIKNAFVDGPFGSNLKTEHFVENGDVYVIDSGLITSGVFHKKREMKTITNDHFETVLRSECKQNDIIIAKIGANFGMSGILPKLNKPSLVSGNTLKLTVNEELYDLKLVHLQLLNLKTQGEIDLLVKGSAQPALSMGVMSDLPFVISTSLEEQTAIANYLDQKTTQIDTLIAKKQHFISLLQEERTAVINQAVTKGLDPNVKMKDSGIEWLGEIPEHWEVKKLKHICRLITKKANEKPDYVLALENIKSWSGEIIGNPFENKMEGDAILFEENDVLFSKLRPYLAKVIKTTRNGGCVGELLVLRAENKVSPDFLYQRLSSEMIITIVDGSTYGTKMPRASWDKFISNLCVGLPPIKEQIDIANYLNNKIFEIETIIYKAQQEIELLEEYKTALISEVVTGKVDVRGINLN